jgi:hydrogenase nickel incorporation protein HypA/HybF
MVACPACGGVDIEVTGDEDVILESITVANSDVDGIPEEEMASR